eukprot:s72_g43.t2
MPRAAPRGREHRERKDEKRKVGRRSQERLDQAPDDEQERDRKRSAETKKWGKCIFLLLGAAAFQALVGLSLLQSHSEALNRSDLLVNSGGVAGPLAVFADPEAPFVVEVKDEGKERVVDPGDLAVLVLSTARKVWLLRATLQSLSRVDGLRAANVLVSLASPGTENQLDAIQEFGFACAGFEGKGGNIKKYFPIFQQAAQGSPHVRRSLEFARKHFAGKEMTSLLVLEEGQIFSLELLWFFVQLLPVLRHDESIFCASAWNENGLAPYVADLTVLHRSDNFSSIAWMLELRRVQPLLAAWKQENDWRNWLQQHMVDAKQQCIFPEVSRVGLASADCLRPSSGPSANAAAAAAHVAKLRQLNVPVTAAPSTKCTEEEVQSQRVSLRSVTSGQLRGFLGDVLRMQAQSYEEWFLWRWPGRQGMFYSQAVRSVTELDVQLGYEPAFLEDAERPRQVLVRAPLRLVLTSAPGSAWAEVAKYFGFPSDRPRATYQGVIRFWWRNVVLYLVLDPSSPLLESTERYQSTWVRSAFGGGAAARSPQLSPAQFKDHLKDLQRPPHRAIPPGAAISAAPLGESCLRHCEAQGQLCVDADLTAVAACAPPVTLSFGCKICEEEAVTSAFPGLHRDTGRCAAGQPAPGASDAGIMAGDCSAAAPRVRRFCVCRLPLVQSSSVGGKTHLRLKSPGLHFAHEAKTSHADVASAESLEAFKASTVKARPNTYAKLNLFSAGLLPAGDPRLGPIRSIFVLVLQPTVQSVASLRNLTGLVPSNVLLVSDGPLKVDSDFRTFTRGRTTAGWKGEALKKGSVMAKEVKATSLLLLEGGQALSPDLLVLLGQLEPLLHSESSLWCVSAWNDHGLAPYVADSTNVLRTDNKQFSTPRRPDPMHRSEKDKDLGSRSTERSPMVLSEEQDQTKRNERKDEKNGTEVNTKMSRPRTLLEQLHWKAAQFSHPHVEPGPSIPVRPRDRAKDHPKNLPTPNRKSSEPRKADGPKERIARQVRAVGAGPTGRVKAESSLRVFKMVWEAPAVEPVELCFEAIDLLGLDQAACSSVLEDLAKKLRPIPPLEFKSFSDCSYLTCKALGVQVRLVSGKADVVFLYNENVEGFNQFRGTLPEGLEWSHESKDVILMLGEPSDKYGGGRFRAVGISYETLGLDIQFKESSWEDQKNPIAFISVFQRLDPSHGLCELCGKRASFRCGLCKNKRYCSSDCQKKDWLRHQKECSGYLEKPSLQCDLLPRCQQASKLVTHKEVILDAMD